MYDSLTTAFVAFLRDNGVVFAGLTAVLAATTLAAVARWMRARDQLRVLGDVLSQQERPPELVARLQALEGAVDTLALGVERLNETELFAAKLVAENRVPAPKAPESHRVITPH